MENTTPNTIEAIFKCNLRDLRISAQLTKKATAENLGISKGYYHSLENSNRHQTPSFETIEGIIRYYNIAASELFEQPGQGCHDDTSETAK